MAELYEYKDYVVRKGDTLWDISSKHLKDPFQWPMIWKENLRINNPDLIYPGQKIRIPVSVITQEVKQIAPEPAPPPKKIVKKVVKKIVKKPAKKKEPVAKTIEPVDIGGLLPREAFAATGYISREVPYRGEITGSPEGRSLFAMGDEIYLKSVEPAKAGDRFYVIRKEARVRHPRTGDSLGYLVRVLAAVETEKIQKGRIQARVIESYDAIYTGDVLDDFYEIDPSSSAGIPRKPDIKGAVVASTYMKLLSGRFDIVYIDRGREDGLRIGDMLMTMISGDRANGVIQVVNLRDTTATAVVLRSKAQVSTGDIVSGLK